MFAINRTLNAVNVAFTAAEVIASYDYVTAGKKVINASATVTAIVIGVCSYVWTALLLFWESNGDQILTAIVRFTVTFMDACGSVYYAGRNFRPVASHYCAQLADSTFYMLAA
jgi:hypothetical protein